MPFVLDVSVTMSWCFDDEATPAASVIFLQRLKRLPFAVENRLVPVTGEDLLPLILTHSLTAYDAAYLDFALRKGWPLATLGKDLIRAAQREGLPVLGQPQ